MQDLFKSIPEQIREDILCKAAAYGEAGQDKQTAIWTAAQESLREAIAERREISELIEQIV